MSVNLSMLAAGDSWLNYIVPIIIVLSLFSKFFQRKREEPGTGAPADDTARGGASPASGQKTLSWEEEIKRLLEGESPQAPPASPPPVILVESRPAPPPPPVFAPRERPREEEEFTPVPVPPIFRRHGPTEESESHESHEGLHTPWLRQAEAALAQAGQLHESVAQRFESVDRATGTARPALVPVRSHRRSADVEAVLALLKQPRSARQVVIAQTVLGAPKGLEV